MKFAVIGGDKRSALLCSLLWRDRHIVHSFALEKAELPAEIPKAGCLQSCVYGADCVILPTPAEKNGLINAPYASMPLAVVNGGEQMKVTASVSETLVPQLAIGDTAEVTVSAIGQTFTAVIRSVERAANLQTKLYTVTLTVPAEVEGLLSGMFADVVFRTDVSENTIVVPSDAILTSEESQYVFTVEDGAARYCAVTTGLTGSGVTEIVSGLSEGDLVVTVGQTYLADGDAVRIVEPEA